MSRLDVMLALSLAIAAGVAILAGALLWLLLRGVWKGYQSAMRERR